jgi:hypothetical protein
MSEKTQNTGNENKKIEMNGIVVSELDFGRVKYMLVRVFIPKNDSHYIVMAEYNDNDNDNSSNTIIVKSCGLYPEDALSMAVKKADIAGNSEEIEKLYMLLGKFELDRWNGKIE